MAVAEPYGRPRDFVARMAGLGRPVLWSLAATSVLGVVAGIAGGAWAVYEAGRSADAVQRYVVYLDAGMAFTQITQTRAESIVKDLVKAGEVQTEQAQATVSDLIGRSRRNTDFQAIVEV